MAKHRKQTRAQRLALRAAVGVMPTALAVTGGVAHAGTVEFVTQQPGVTTPDSPAPDAPAPSPRPVQPGVTTPPSAPPPAPAVQPSPPPTEYVAPADDAHGVAPRTDYAQYRRAPQRNYVNPIQPQNLHSPAPSPRVAQILPPPRVLRAGDLSVAAPEFLSPDQIAQINAVPAGPEAQISQFARSVGVAPSRADSVASGAVAGTVEGAVIGCVAASTAAVGLVITAPLAPVACASWGTAGAIAGTLVGAGMGGLRR